MVLETKVVRPREPAGPKADKEAHGECAAGLHDLVAKTRVVRL